MEDSIDAIHFEVFSNFNDEETNHLLIWLQQVYRVVAFTNKYLSLLSRQELYEFLVQYSSVLEFEGRVHERDIAWKCAGHSVMGYLKISQYFLCPFSWVQLESLHPWIAKTSLKTLIYPHFFVLFSQRLLNSTHRV